MIREENMITKLDEGIIFLRNRNYYLVVGCKELEKPVELYDTIQILMGNETFYSLLYTIVRLDKVTAYKKAIQKNPYYYVKEEENFNYIKQVDISRYKVDLVKRKMLDGLISDSIKEIKEKQLQRAKEYFAEATKYLKDLKLGQVLKSDSGEELAFTGIDLYGQIFVYSGYNSASDRSYEQLKKYTVTDKIIEVPKRFVFGLTYGEWIQKCRLEI